MEKNTNNINTFNVNMDNLSEEEREQLIALVEKSNEKKNKVWKPEFEDLYYAILPDGSITDYEFTNSEFDNSCYDFCNCFKTASVAKFFAEKQRVMTQLKRYAEEHNDVEIDWDNCEQYKYFLYCDSAKNEIGIDSRSVLMFSNQIYFTSYDIAEDAVKEIGKDRILKYLFGVETAK